MTRAILLLLILLSVFIPEAHAQRFGAALLLGANASQIDGDEMAGYDKLGLNAGIRGTAQLKGRWTLGLELLYSQRGSRSRQNTFVSPVRREIELDYIEIPVFISVHDWLVSHEKGDFYKVRAFAGLSYGRLFRTRVYDDNTASGYDDRLAEEFNTDDIGGLIGIAYSAYRNLEFSAKYTRSFTRIYNASESPALIPLSLAGYFISFNIAYVIQ